MAEDRVAIVTAAGRGIGAGVARVLHERGYKLALMSPSERSVNLAKELGCIGLKGSVLKTADLETLVRTTLDRHGHIDAVCNNTGFESYSVGGESHGVGFKRDVEPNLLEIPDEGWHEGLDLLMLNVVRMARLVTPHMMKRGKGALVNISSAAAHAPMLEYPLTSTVRTGLSAFTRLYSDKYARHNIRMNSLLVGYALSYEFTPDAAACIPMGRIATCEEAGKIVALLLSEDASYVTGENLYWDGGLVRSLF